MAIIIFGQLDKKLIFVVLVIVVNTINYVIPYYFDYDYSFIVFRFITKEVGTILAGIILLFIFRQKEKKKGKNLKSFKYILLLFFTRGIEYGYK